MTQWRIVYLVYTGFVKECGEQGVQRGMVSVEREILGENSEQVLNFGC